MEAGENMITTLNIHNFRCFQDLSVTKLAPITLLGGRNNSGKSAILEAIFLSFSYWNGNVFSALAASRSSNGQLPSPERIWNPLFFNFEKTDEFSLSVEQDNGKTSVLTMKKVPDENVSLDINTELVSGIFKQGYALQDLDHYFFALEYTHTEENQTIQGRYSFENTQIRNMPSSDNPKKDYASFVKVSFYRNLYIPDNGAIAEWVGKFILDGRKEDLLAVLRLFDGRISDIMTLVENNLPYVYVTLADGMKMPITYMGDGINKALNLLLIILTSPNGIVLLDEIENGFHYSVYPKVLRALYEAALGIHCQLVITTHNADILRQSVAVMKALNQLEALSYQRLSVSDKGRKAYAFSGDELEVALDAELEVR
ncbi:AAA family ATPase [Megasphaera massiliensis]|uniref:AAA family ATPase n=1 Tax=Megasphaera massiliensis TaxID=1232428 RepID=UPI000402678F|nr:ATP-binding protein [Megasphaera massiliensis]MBS6256765.1 AAA family ATPase [Megasphaera sp.]